MLTQLLVKWLDQQLTLDVHSTRLDSYPMQQRVTHRHIWPVGRTLNPSIVATGMQYDGRLYSRGDQQIKLGIRRNTN